jgi:DNA-binding transcriptional ArsR family regulator
LHDFQVNDEATDRLLRALSDATRRHLLDRLRDEPGLTLTALTAGFAQSRQALSKHLAALEAADLLVAVWRGREKLHYLNPVPLQALPSRWVTTTAREHGAALAALNQALQATGETAPAEVIGDALTQLLLCAPGAGWHGERIANAAQLTALHAYLADTAQAVQRLLSAMGPQQGYEQPAGGGFSLAQHLWHLADLDTLGWRVRLQRVLGGKSPLVLPGVNGDQLAIEGRYQQRPWRGAARRFVAERRRALADLQRLDTAHLTRPVKFSGQPGVVGDVLAAWMAHDREHRLEMAPLWQALQASA